MNLESAQTHQHPIMSEEVSKTNHYSIVHNEWTRTCLAGQPCIVGIRMATSVASVCCKLYISESRNARALESIAKAGRALILNVFRDDHYNRVGYTLATPLSSSAVLHSSLMSMVTAALHTIDLQEHSGTHPRLGVVDHICFHPLGNITSLSHVAPLAQSLAKDIGTTLQVPTYLYGAAHPENRALDSIRRTLGYFTPDNDGKWVGLGSNQVKLQPDHGPTRVSPKSGFVVVGACPWVVNYNVPITSNDLAKGRRIARGVSTRGGGLAGVQSMALLHGEQNMEIACNLLDSKIVGPDKVQEEIENLAGKEGLAARKGYLTDYLEEQILEACTLVRET